MKNSKFKMTNRSIFLIPLLLIIGHLSLPFLSSASPPTENKGFRSIQKDDFKEHIKYLASDELEGRRAGEEGERKAGDYIAGEFERFGLAPLGDGGTYFQTLEVIADVRLGDENSLEFLQILPGVRNLITDIKFEKDYIPFGFSSRDKMDGELVFCGYGITAKEYHYDDYADVDVEGKIVVVLRHEPQENEPHSVFQGTDFTHYAGLRDKVINARNHGAKGLLLVNDPNNHLDEDDELVTLSYGGGTKDAGIPSFHLKRLIVEELLKSLGKDLKEIQTKIDKEFKPESFVMEGVRVKAFADVVRERKPARNVVGYIEGKNSHETIVVGAHYDHLGFGGEGSLEPDRHEPHNGADDNASGTAGLLELAEAFALQKDQLKKSIIFVAFTGEEIGLLGSNHYVNNSPVPLEETITMVNMDMIGRPKNNRLMVSGVETGKGLKSKIKKLNRKARFNIAYHDDGWGPSDHTPFNAKKIPVLFFFTGAHEDYHRTSDDWEKIQYRDIERVTRLVYRTVYSIQGDSEAPGYVEVASAPSRSMGGGGGYGAYLGVIPEFGNEGDGVSISGVRTDSPAEKAGLKGGDVIIEMGGKEIRDLYDLTYVLRSQKPGDDVELFVKREGKKIELKATLGKRGGGGKPKKETEDHGEKGAGEMRGSLEVGNPAPGFTLRTVGGKDVSLEDFQGKKNVVLYFYPRDDTPGCTKEACNFRDNLPNIEALNTEILGVSVDGLDSHAKFSEKYNLNFTLLSDEDKEVSKQYGVLNEEKGTDRRVTFIIDKEGVLRHVFSTVKVDVHTDEVLEVLENL
jgi:peroxiredoxin